MVDMTTMDWIAYAVAALFAIGGGVMNLLAPPKFIEDYRRWGYPSWWRYVTAALMFLGAALLTLRDTRMAGSMLLAAIAVAAILTLIRHREFRGAIAPTVLFLIALIPLLPVRGVA